MSKAAQGLLRPPQGGRGGEPVACGGSQGGEGVSRELVSPPPTPALSSLPRDCYNHHKEAEGESQWLAGGHKGGGGEQRTCVTPPTPSTLHHLKGQ